VILGDCSRTASVMRTALVGRPMLRFDAPELVGPVPQAGRMVEVVESRGKHLEVMWDDGLVLDTHLRGSSEWHVYRCGAPWRRSWDRLRASIQTDAFVAVCFDAPHVETYRQFDRERHPGRGRLGPDLGRRDADLELAVELMMSYPDPEAPLRDVIADQHVMRGVGNVYRCEVLWAAELSPWAHAGDLRHHDAELLVDLAGQMIRSNLDRAQRATTRLTPGGLAVYGRTGQACIRCHDTVASQPVGPYGRMLYWCPGCQVRLDRHLPTDVREMDPHPAAARYLNELPWRRRDEHGDQPSGRSAVSDSGTVEITDPLMRRRA
jgi:endonuclease-8